MRGLIEGTDWLARHIDTWHFWWGPISAGGRHTTVVGLLLWQTEAGRRMDLLNAVGRHVEGFMLRSVVVLVGRSRRHVIGVLVGTTVVVGGRPVPVLVARADLLALQMGVHGATIMVVARVVDATHSIGETSTVQGVVSDTIR